MVVFQLAFPSSWRLSFGSLRNTCPGPEKEDQLRVVTLALGSLCVLLGVDFFSLFSAPCKMEFRVPFFPWEDWINGIGGPPAPSPLR